MFGKVAGIAHCMMKLSLCMISSDVFGSTGSLYLNDKKDKFFEDYCYCSLWDPCISLVNNWDKLT